MFPIKTSPNLPHETFIISVLLHLLLVQSADEKYETCSQPKVCGADPPLTIKYPFFIPDEKRDFCGYPGFHVVCKENKAVYNTSHGEYMIRNISYEDHSLRLVNPKVLDAKCIPRLIPFALDRSPFLFDQNFVDLKLLYSCNETFPRNNYTRLQTSCEPNKSLQSYAVLDPRREIKCEELPCLHCVAAPVELEETDQNETFESNLDYEELLENGFILKWNGISCSKCEQSGGLCGFDGSNGPVCYCPDHPHREHCYDGNSSLKQILFIGGVTTAALTSTFIILFVFIWGKRAKEKHKYEKDIQLFLKSNGNLAPRRYKYSSIKKMTKSFSENLGKGGYGSVYKGQFPDGHLVAVKVLNESINGNGEDFMNEVASISRASHINIISLLGFCFEGSKRALIYDFMPNGSLEKFIGNNAPAEAESGLGWDKLFEIALGIARGLEYLHQGCNMRILHLDIKPQNILLDKNLNPRISDFGLAKLCPNRSSIVSMMVARGTIGYIAPEVFSRNFGEVSYKSDVYSYGILVLEMVGGRKNIDPRDVDHTSETYFPNYIYKQLEMDAGRNIGDLVETMNEDESQVVKRNLIIVGLWCIQTNPKDRPSMTKVVEMLEGKHGAMEVPPKPYLYSPPRSPTIGISSCDSIM